MNIFFSKVMMSDFEDFYILKCDEENIRWTGYDKGPDKDMLRQWFYKQLKRKDRIMFLIRLVENGEAVGYLYLDIVGENANIIETGHGVLSKFKGHGLGTKIITYAVNYTKGKLNFIDEIDGWIAVNNIGSIKNVLKNGYSKTNETKKVVFKGFNKELEMQKFVYKIQR